MARRDPTESGWFRFHCAAKYQAGHSLTSQLASRWWLLHVVLHGSHAWIRQFVPSSRDNSDDVVAADWPDQRVSSGYKLGWLRYYLGGWLGFPADQQGEGLIRVDVGCSHAGFHLINGAYINWWSFLVEFIIHISFFSENNNNIKFKKKS